MALTRRHLLALAGSSAACPTLARAADDWPSRPIKLIVGTAPGGSPDIIGRILADKLAAKLGQSVFVENMTSGAGAIAQLTVAKSEPDGYTLGMLTSGFPPQMVMRKNVGFDPLDGFAFVTLVCGYPMVYAVRPDSPIASFNDLLARAKTERGHITYTINALGSIYHMLTKWIELEAGIEMSPIPYRGTAAAVSDVLAGRVDVMVDAATSALPRIQNGQLRVLALSSPQRYPLMPDTPSMVETVSGVQLMSWLGLAAPPQTPRPIIDLLNSEIRRALDLPDVRSWLAETGVLAAPSSPEELQQRVETEIALYSKIAEVNAIRAE